MILEGYRLQSQLGVGSDGSTYLAENTAGESMEVRVLFRVAGSPQRWAAVCKRLRLLAAVESSAVRPLAQVELSGPNPFVAMPWEGDDTLSRRLSEGPMDVGASLALARAVGLGLWAMHRLGLYHGALCPSAVSLDASGSPRIDGTRLDTVFPPVHTRTRFDPSCMPPEVEVEGADHASDVYSLGAMVLCMVTGTPARPDGLSMVRDLDAEVADLLSELLSPRPEDRPSSAEVCGRLAMLAGGAEQVSNTSPQIPSLMKTEATGPSGAPDTVPDRVPGPSTADSPGTGPSGAPDTVPDRVPGPSTADSPGLPSAAAPRKTELEVGDRLGRFEVLGCIGKGGMGEVYRARDIGDDRPVALKVLKRSALQDRRTLSRFRREARLLSRVRSPYVANLIEANEEDGIHYIASELVEGADLQSHLEARGALTEHEALVIMADVARALVDAHKRGIVHRDIKPPNILIASRTAPTRSTGGGSIGDRLRGRVKLVDFGIAMEVKPSEGDEGEKGSVLGTPWYMSPEQCTGAPHLGPPADVYAMGATVFHLIAGRPPFMGDNPVAIIYQHMNESPPRLDGLRPSASPSASELIDRTLAKDPSARQTDADHLLDEMLSLLGGAPNDIFDHPKLPEGEPASLKEYRFEWDLKSSPGQLWPYVSNTDRLNRTVGLKPVAFQPCHVEGEISTYQARAREAGLAMSWCEHPFEWVERQRFAVLREFNKGPMDWYLNEVTLTPSGEGGTKLVHSVTVAARNLIGKVATRFKIGRKLGRQWDEFYTRLDNQLQAHGERDDEPVDVFGGAEKISAAGKQRLEAALARIREQGVSPQVVEKLGHTVRHSSAQELARVRPIALANRLGIDEGEVIAACLHGARLGLFESLWDLLCPTCRIPSEVKQSLRVLGDHGNCEACDIDFSLDFDQAIELIFRVDPAIRSTEVRTYCVGGPGNTPHVVAQVRLERDEHFVLNLGLKPGAYRLHSRQIEPVFDFRVEPRAGASRLDIDVGPGGYPDDLPRELTAFSQVIAVHNAAGAPILLRLERRAPREDALTAARASTIALFRRLYPEEAPSARARLTTQAVTFLATDLENGSVVYDFGREEGKRVIEAMYRVLAQAIEAHGGAVVKHRPFGVFAVFSDAAAAVEAALALQSQCDQDQTTKGLRVRAALHRGPATVSEVDGQLDYYGDVVSHVMMLPEAIEGRHVLLSRSLAEDPAVEPVYRSAGLVPQVVGVHLEDDVAEWGVQLQIE